MKITTYYNEASAHALSDAQLLEAYNVNREAYRVQLEACNAADVPGNAHNFAQLEREALRIEDNLIYLQSEADTRGVDVPAY